MKKCIGVVLCPNISRTFDNKKCNFITSWPLKCSIYIILFDTINYLMLMITKIKWNSKVGKNLKSVNLQYNTQVLWAYGTNDLSTSIWCSKYNFSFFIKSCRILSIYFLLFYKVTKIKINSFECPKSWTSRASGLKTMQARFQTEAFG